MADCARKKSRRHSRSLTFRRRHQLSAFEAAPLSRALIIDDQCFVNVYDGLKFARSERTMPNRPRCCHATEHAHMRRSTGVVDMFDRDRRISTVESPQIVDVANSLQIGEVASVAWHEPIREDREQRCRVVALVKGGQAW